MKKVLLVFGTRPEAIKMAPLYTELKRLSSVSTELCVTGQHSDMLLGILDFFKMEPDYSLSVMSAGQTLNQLSAKMLTALDDVFAKSQPDLIFVHGDTATTLAATLAAYHRKIKVAHVEAGLRTGNLYSPWPEEGNRKVVGALANYHLSPTESAKANLIDEGIDPDSITVTGNTVIDALFRAKKILDDKHHFKEKLKDNFSFLDSSKRLILVTGHRRESFGKGFENICTALKLLAKANPDVNIVYPVHFNPNVREIVHEKLSGLNNIFLIEPQGYPEFLILMESAYLILTDSGGVQEEAPSLGKPVLVMRDTTERREAIDAGTVILVGTSVDEIVKNVSILLNNRSDYLAMSQASNPYGDGKAVPRIIDFLKLNAV